MIEATSSELIVYGNGDKNSQTEYIHKGIAKRAFTKTFRLADNVVVDGAECVRQRVGVDRQRAHARPRKAERLGTTRRAGVQPWRELKLRAGQ